MSKKITVVSRILLSLLLILSLCLPIGTIMVSAEEDVGGAAVTDVSFNFDADYGQTEAREMLDLVNGFRTSPTDAWHWASNNTDKVSYDGEDRALLEELAYDYTLEEVAMQRAAEIAILFDHVRPDGSAWSTAFPLDENGNSIYSGRGENIAWGVGMTAEAAYTAWREDPCEYARQGHRRNMLSPNFNCIGIGHCQVNGVDFWVQSLGYKDTPDEEETSACDVTTTAVVATEKSLLSFSDVKTTPLDTTMEYGVSQAAPKASAEYVILSKEHRPENTPFPVKVDTNWTSSNPAVLSVTTSGSDVLLTALKPGSATLSSQYTPLDADSGSEPENITFTITVSPLNISGTDVVLEFTEVEYNGKEHKPAVKGLTKDGKPLPVSASDFTVSSTDFTVSYSDVTEVGTGKVTVTGKGNYTGTTTGTFTIKPCQHTYDDGVVKKAATCTADGEKLFTCTKCRHTKIEAIKATGHTPGATATCTTDQKCTVCDAVITKAPGHTPVSGTFDCTVDQKCSVCNEDYHKAGQHTPGDAATCTTPQKCKVCDAVINLAKGHTPGAAATCTTDQTCTVCKEVIKKATGHTPGTAATCGTPQKCTVCGAVVTKATGKHTDSNNDRKCDVCAADTSGKGPITGEMIKNNMPVIIAFAAVIISAIVILVLVIKRRGSRRAN